MIEYNFNKDVCIVIPSYKDKLSENDVKAFQNYATILKNRDRIIVCPYRMIKNKDYRQLESLGYKFRFFADKFFNNVYSYNEMCLCSGFYKAFTEYKYMLIAQLDSWIFSDKLDYWIDKEYDYCGGALCGSCPYRCHEDLCKYNHSPYYSGQGGFSLRKISSFIDFLENWDYVHPLIGRWEEDIAFGKSGKLSMPDCIESKHFSMEIDIVNNIKCHKIYPMAIHSWEHAQTGTEFNEICKLMNEYLNK